MAQLVHPTAKHLVIIVYSLPVVTLRSCFSRTVLPPNVLRSSHSLKSLGTCWNMSYAINWCALMGFNVDLDYLDYEYCIDY